MKCASCGDEIDSIVKTKYKTQAVSELKKIANLYQTESGEPGPLSDDWGWREIAHTLRKIAEKLVLEGDK